MIIKQFIKFSLVGLLNTGIHYAMFLFLYRSCGINYLFASAVGYSCGLLNSFILNKNWTFKTINVRRDVEFIKFILVNIVALAINIIALKFFVEAIKIIPEISQVLAIVSSFIVNFLGNKYWTFRSHNKFPEELKGNL
jgi:putative flippase GtrA